MLFLSQKINVVRYVTIATMDFFPKSREYIFAQICPNYKYVIHANINIEKIFFTLVKISKYYKRGNIYCTV